MREYWFIITLVTHSSGVSSSGVSRGIHHKCKCPLNPTKLYVSGWVESSRSVLFGRSKHAGGVMYVWWTVYMYLTLLMKWFCALAYPTFFVVWSVWYSLLRWSSTCWCEHMRGTPVGNRGMEIPLPSPHGPVYVSVWVI